MNELAYIALAFVVGCGAGYFMKDWFNDQLRKLKDKND